MRGRHSHVGNVCKTGAIYSWKGRQLLEKMSYISPKLASQFGKSGEVGSERLFGVQTAVHYRANHYADRFVVVFPLEADRLILS